MWRSVSFWERFVSDRRNRRQSPFHALDSNNFFSRATFHGAHTKLETNLLKWIIIDNYISVLPFLVYMKWFSFFSSANFSTISLLSWSVFIHLYAFVKHFLCQKCRRVIDLYNYLFKKNYTILVVASLVVQFYTLNAHLTLP